MKDDDILKYSILIDKKFVDKIDLYKIISRLEKRIVPSLTSSGINLLEYVEKLIQNAIFVEVREKEMVCGLAALYANDIESKSAYLTFIAVDKNFERKGIGRILLNNVEKIAIQNGMQQIILEVSIENVHAQHFYIKNGYNEFEKTSSHSIFMRKLLKV